MANINSDNLSDIMLKVVMANLSGEEVQFTEEESAMLSEYFKANAGNEKWFRQITSKDYILQTLNAQSGADLRENSRQALLKTIRNGNMYEPVYQEPRPSVFLRRMVKNRSAAAILLVLLLGVLAYFVNKHTSIHTSSLAKAATIHPAAGEVTLQLGEGRILDLLKQTGELRPGVINNKEGLFYIPSSIGSVTTNNILATGKGKTYSLTLSDGSVAILNAESSIRYPMAFSGNERRVEIDGVAYFKVAKDATQPFRVTVADGTVEVKGTTFCVDAREGKLNKVSLLEGAVQVSANDNQVMLAPGDEAVAASGTLSVKKYADWDDISSWMQGKLVFHETSVKDILTELSHWYPIEIKYLTEVNEKFTIQVHVKDSINETLSALEKTGKIHFNLSPDNLLEVSQ